ncbi:hypothetical protein AB0F11_13955 [Streptomyces sp. NPDC032472]|uniref:hypothetical protein n=1 Tax=Streptomyces sp. NPDC032472 TaxID=3155018 RepID=UPI0033E3CFD6
MANIVWHTKLKMRLDLTQNDLGQGIEGLWDLIYDTDRLYASRNVPVSERGLQCGGICQEKGVVAWMHLRLRANGRREAVHERAEDEERHKAPMSDEHKAYQERILRAAEEGGFPGDSEVRTPVGTRGWIQTDTLVEGEGGRRIGWEIQLSSAGAEGPRSVKARAAKAAKLGITPAWHTDRVDYARRNDTQWTGSNNLPAHVIAKTGDLRVVSGFRALDFWLCDLRALYPCPDGVRRCGKHHVTPKPRDVLFDDLVRQTAAGSIVPVEHLRGSRLDKFWVTSADRDRLEDLLEGTVILNPAPPEGAAPKSSPNAPTCRTATDAASPAQPVAITSPATLNTPIATGGTFSTTRPISRQRVQDPAPVLTGGSSHAPRPDGPPEAETAEPSVDSVSPGPVELQQTAEQATSLSVEFPSEIEQVYDSGVTSNANVFPDDLLQLQERLHRIRAEHTAYLAGLPWSVEPVKGWARGERFSHRGDVPDSPGWTPEQKERVDRMWQELRDLSAAVVDHPYWKTVEREKVVEARMLLKKQARPAAPSAAENASEAA